MSYIFRGLKRIVQTENEYIQFQDTGTQENEMERRVKLRFLQEMRSFI